MIQKVRKTKNILSKFFMKKILLLKKKINLPYNLQGSDNGEDEEIIEDNTTDGDKIKMDDIIMKRKSLSNF